MEATISDSLFLSHRFGKPPSPGFSFEKYRVQQISAHICDRGGGFAEAISLVWSNCGISLLL